MSYHYTQYPHHHYASHPGPVVDTHNIYDSSQVGAPNVEVSHLSPVLPSGPHLPIPPTARNDTQITHNHMVASVPNPESQYPNQTSYDTRIPPTWARPSPESTQQQVSQALNPMQYPNQHQHHHRSSSHHSQESYPQNFDRRASVDSQASGYGVNPGYAGVAQQHQPNQYEQNYYQQPDPASGFTPSQSAHVYPHSYVHAQQTVASHHHVQNYQPAQYQADQHLAESQTENQNIVCEMSGGQTTFGLYMPAEYEQQRELAQNAPYEPYEQQQDGLLLTSPYHFNGVDSDQAAVAESQNHEQYDHSQTQQYHQHVEHQGHEFPEHDDHEVVQPKVEPEYEYHQHAGQCGGHSRRNSEFAVAHEQTQFQQATPVVQHQYPQNPTVHEHHVRGHSHSRSSSTSEPPAKKLAVAAPNPLLYPDEPKTQLVSTGENPNQPEDTPARRDARFYQTDLEIKFLERAALMGRSVVASYPRTATAAGEYQDQAGSSPQRVQPIVPSQAHERPVAVPVPVVNSGAHSPDKKDPQTTPKKPALACLFCRKRKIACGPPPPDSPDRTCNQCARRKQPCEYPTESRRGIRKPAVKEQVKDESDDGSSPSPSAMRFVKHDPDEKPKGKARRKRSYVDMLD